MSPPVPPILPRKMVFVVEDETRVVNFLTRELDDLGCDTTPVIGPSARTLANTLVAEANRTTGKCCDGIILDLHYPLDGQEERGEPGGPWIWATLEQKLGATTVKAKFGTLMILTKDPDDASVAYFADRTLLICYAKENREMRREDLQYFVRHL